MKDGETTIIEWKNTPITGQIQITKYADGVNTITGQTSGVTHAVTWSHRDSFCEGQYEVQPEEFPTAPVKTQLRQLPKPASNLSFAKFDFDDEEELL